MCTHKSNNISTIIIVYTYDYSKIDNKKYRIRDYAYCYLCGKKFTVSP